MRPRNEGVTTSYKLEVEPSLAIDLDAFCSANRGGPPRVGIIREAIREYIVVALRSDSELEKRFLEAKERIMSSLGNGSNIHLITSRKG